MSYLPLFLAALLLTPAARAEDYFRQGTLETGVELLRTIPTTEYGASALLYSPDGRVLAAAGWNKQAIVRLFDSESGRQLVELAGPDKDKLSWGFSPDGSRFAAGGRHKVYIVETRTGKILRDATIDASDASNPRGDLLVMSPDGAFAAAPDGARLRVWALADGREAAAFDLSDGQRVSALAFRPGTDELFAAGESILLSWNVKTRAPRHGIVDACAERASRMAFAPDGARLALVTSNNNLCLWDPVSLALQEQLDTATGWSSFLWFSRDGKLLISRDKANERPVRVWSMDDMRGVSQAPTYFDAAAIDPQWRSLLTLEGEYGKTLAFHDPATGILESSSAKGGQYDRQALALSPDGSLALARETLVDTATGRYRTVTERYGTVAVAFNPDGKSFALGNYQKDIELYRLVPAPRPKVPAPASPAAPRLTATYIPASPEGAARPERAGRLRLSLVNAGTGPAYALRVAAYAEKPVAGLLTPEDWTLETLAAGASAALEVPLRADPLLATGKAVLRFEVNEGNGFDGAAVRLSVPTRAFEPPRLELASLSYAGGGAFERGKSVEVHVGVRNSGGGAARGVAPALETGSPDLFLEKAPPILWPELAPGETKTASFKLFVNNRYAGGASLPAAITVAEATGRHGLASVSLGLLLDKPAPPPPAPAASAEEFRVRRVMSMVAGYPSDFAASADGTVLAATTGDRVTVWDAKGAVLRTFTDSISGEFKPYARPQLHGLSGDGKTALVSFMNEYRLYDVATGKFKIAWKGPRSVLFWKNTPEGIQSRRVFTKNYTVGAGLSRDGRRAAISTCREDATSDTRVVDLVTGTDRALASSQQCANRMVFSPDGRTIALSYETTVEIWDAETSAAKGSFSVPGQWIESLAISDDGGRVAAAGYQGDLAVWDLASRTAILRAVNHERSGGLALSPDGRWAAVSSYSGGALFDLRTGTLKGEYGFMNALAFLPDGRLLSGGSNNAVMYALGASSAPKPKLPAKLTVKLAFRDPSGDGVLDGGEKGEVQVEVMNDGLGTARGVRLSAAFETGGGVRLPALVDLGDVEPGKSKSATLPLSASPEALTQPVRLRIDAREANGFDGAASVQFETRALQAPRLEVAAVELNGSGVVRANEVNRVSVTVRNAGSGAARGVTARLTLGHRDIFGAGDLDKALGTVEPGRTAKVVFEFFVNARFTGKSLPVSLSLSEALGRFGVDDAPLGLSMGEAPSASVLKVQARSAAAAPAAAADASVDAPPASRTEIDPDALAVVIGVERYRQAGLPRVDHAARDARTMHAYLTSSMGFDPRNVALLLDEGAGKADLEKYLGPWLKNRATAKSRVFVYFAGHGAPNPATGEGFLVPFDGDPSYTAETAFPLKRLYDALGALPARSVLIALDSCFSGRGGRSLLAKGARPLISAKTPSVSSANTVVLTATGGDQISTSHPDEEHGLMTYFLLKGLRGAADADKDGKVTTLELFRYLGPEVERTARRQNVEQTPSLSPAPDRIGDRGGEAWIRLR